jgi:fructokinase
MALFGAVEAGGTKFVCGLATGPDDLVQTVFPTTSPEETMARCIAFFRAHEPAAALGIASFGPVDLDCGSPSYGYITSTPKPGWANIDIAGGLARGLGIPVAFETDVNAAALAESRWGAARGIDDVVYLTIGTGIGGGALVGGRLVHGLVHPEMGHMRIPHDSAADPFAGACPYHGDCLEGLACGPAIEQRWGAKAEDLPPAHAAWELQASYLALCAANLVCTLSPKRIIMGGGVMQQAFLFPLVRERLARILNGYVRMPDVVPPLLGANAGVLGGIALASAAAGV